MTAEAIQWPWWLPILERALTWIVILVGGGLTIRWGKHQVGHLKAALQEKDVVIQAKDAHIASLQDDLRQWRDRAPAGLVADMEAILKWATAQRQAFQGRMQLAATIAQRLQGERDAARQAANEEAIGRKLTLFDAADVILTLARIASAYRSLSERTLSLKLTVI